MPRQIKFFVLSLFLIMGAPVHAGQDEIRQLAEQGDVNAQAKLASMYIMGVNGFEKDEKAASEWILKAAEQGLVEAMVMVAAMYDTGVGFKHNVDTATKWYEKAADKGHGASMAILGRNSAPKGSVGFSYKTMRLRASKQIPTEYAKRILFKK